MAVIASARAAAQMLALAVVLALVVAATAARAQTNSPTKKPTAPTPDGLITPTKRPTLGKCEVPPGWHLRRGLCQRAIDKGCPLKYFDNCPRKCKMENNCSPLQRPFFADGGCRPVSYCGFRCELECNNNVGRCKWTNGICLSIAPHPKPPITPHAPRPHKKRTAYPTVLKTKSPTRKPTTRSPTLKPAVVTRSPTKKPTTKKPTMAG